MKRQSLRLIPKLPLFAGVVLLMGLAGCSVQPRVITATFDNDAARVQSLLNEGADPNAVSETGYTALYRAAEKGQTDIVKTLLEGGARVDASWKGWTPLLAAVRYEGSIETIAALLDGGADMTKRSPDDWSIVLLAARYRDVAMMKYLLKRGASLNVTTDHGWSPLSLAVFADNRELVEYLISVGASPDVKNDDGDDSYTLAAKTKNVTPEMVRQWYAAHQQKQRLERLEDRLAQTESRDSGLPMQFKRDKYLVAFSTALKSENYIDALLYARLLDRLSIPMEDSFYYFWGEALLELDDPEAALTKFKRYINRAGSSGQYYTLALQKLLDAERMLEN
ncbi:Ankyrin [Marinobacterium lacunae]|uniref:Ankyrin n=1 Tax=Marinobacterium lacunae TaxID=1232683 RepID=A0A081FXB1_9GAMM|nr:ankyrin repeat domain-containing protein [Marinobacterium lacunae]KEA63166.1 Ankyrin [Marinobacterium lacunae]